MNAHPGILCTCRAARTWRTGLQPWPRGAAKNHAGGFISEFSFTYPGGELASESVIRTPGSTSDVPGDLLRGAVRPECQVDSAGLGGWGPGISICKSSSGDSSAEARLKSTGLTNRNVGSGPLLGASSQPMLCPPAPPLRIPTRGSGSS